MSNKVKKPQNRENTVRVSGQETLEILMEYITAAVMAVMFGAVFLSGLLLYTTEARGRERGCG